MPIGKDAVHDLLSPRFKAKRDKKKKLRKARVVKAVPPPMVDQRQNHITMAHSTNKTTTLQDKRMISPTEGGPSVNAEAGELANKKFIVKGGSKTVKEVNPEEAAITTVVGKKTKK